jgi:hypothetical protein
LTAGPASWAVSTEATEVVAFLNCDHQRAILVPLDAALIAVSVVCAIASLFSVRAAGREWFDLAGGRTGRFVGVVSFVGGLLFAVVIASQLAATLIVERCSR